MRISERKRQLREQDLSEPRGASRSDERPVAAARPPRARGVAARSGARKPGTQGVGAQSKATARKPRGPRFYAGFGIVGLFFSLILVQSTIANYNNDKNKYPAAHARYLRDLKDYPAALAKYHAELARHVHPTPHAPAVPVAPHVPEISIASFALPILYIVLSLAYLYLAYRASRQRQQPAKPAR